MSPSQKKQKKKRFATQNTAYALRNRQVKQALVKENEKKWKNRNQNLAKDFSLYITAKYTAAVVK